MNTFVIFIICVISSYIIGRILIAIGVHKGMLKYSSKAYYDGLKDGFIEGVLNGYENDDKEEIRYKLKASLENYLDRLEDGNEVMTDSTMSDILEKGDWNDNREI